MDADEVLRLKQISGLTEMFAGRQFSQAWTIKQLQLAQTRRRSQQSRRLFGEAQADQLVRERIGAEDGERDRRYPDFGRQPAAEADIVKIGDGAIVRQQEIGPFTGRISSRLGRSASINRSRRSR